MSGMDWVALVLLCMAAAAFAGYAVSYPHRKRPEPEHRLGPGPSPGPIGAMFDDIRRKAQQELLEQQQRAVMAEAMGKLLAGQEQLLARHEPTEDQVRKWLGARGMMATTPEGAAAYCASQGWVMVRAEQWRQLMEAIGKRGMTVQEWIERPKEE